MKNVTLQVEGMSCNHCVNSVESALKALGAVGKVDLSSKTVAIQYEEAKLELDTIKEAIEEQGYEVVK
ncbi:copper ion binding protein [Paenibacillus eucommiae]|uniref:Copper chaperone n=1 Tax=Paenibacillus eucommiae TaxID=1355755 RepID=A0ABS4J988_9BACL|nr:copper ion binding protein [Paenibacillus eucommiae]MBP1995279.1 copper chaperone [Paenibacillus eucommiae]